MKIGGWTRLGIVLSVLYGIFVVAFAFAIRPTASEIYSSWFYQASNAIAEAITAEEGKTFSGAQIRQAMFDDRTDRENIAWLKSVANDPTEGQKLFADAIGEINRTYEDRISSLRSRTLQHWSVALGVWIGGVAVLFIFGATIGWVYRGFRRGD